RVLAVDDAFGLAGPANVHAQAGIAGGGEDRIGALVARRRAVTLAVSEKLENRRDRLLCRRGRQPDARGQLRAVGEANPFVLQNPERSFAQVSGRRWPCVASPAPARASRAASPAPTSAAGRCSRRTAAIALP